MATEEETEDFIAHFGVKGMKWGVTRDSSTGVRPIAQKLNDSKFGKAATRRAEAHGKKADAKVAVKAAKQLKTDQKKYDKEAAKRYVDTYNKTADYANQVLIPKINKKYADIDVSDPSSKAGQKYINEYSRRFEKAFNNNLQEAIGKRPS